MLEFVKGASVHDPSGLDEGYMVEENSITANVNASKIGRIINSFISANEGEPLFLFIETPTNLNDELAPVPTEGNDFGIAIDSSENVYRLENLHRDVYYLDGLSSQAMQLLLEPFYEILINDGLSAFGVGVHTTKAEIGKYKYNIVTVYSAAENVESYASLFANEGIPEKQKLITAWDIINSDNLGTCDRYEDDNNRTIYDIVEVLQEVGLYKAEQREE